MGLAGRIARRSLLGHPGRTLFSILGVAVGIATVVGVFTLDHVTVLSRTKQLMPDFGADMEVRPTNEEGDAREQLLAMEGVAGVAAFTKYDVGFRRLEARPGEDDRTQRIRLIGLETVPWDRAAGRAGSSWPPVTFTAIALSAPSAREVSVRRPTAPREASASPRKPKE